MGLGCEKGSFLSCGSCFRQTLMISLPSIIFDWFFQVCVLRHTMGWTSTCGLDSLKLQRRNSPVGVETHPFETFEVSASGLFPYDNITWACLPCSASGPRTCRSFVQRRRFAAVHLTRLPLPYSYISAVLAVLYALLVALLSVVFEWFSGCIKQLRNMFLYYPDWFWASCIAVGHSNQGM